jgi:hypothetical protein
LSGMPDCLMALIYSRFVILVFSLLAHSRSTSAYSGNMSWLLVFSFQILLWSSLEEDDAKPKLLHGSTRRPPPKEPDICFLIW